MLRQHYDTDALDASTLLAALFGFLRGDDERLRKSVEAIELETSRLPEGVTLKTLRIAGDAKMATLEFTAARSAEPTTIGRVVELRPKTKIKGQTLELPTLRIAIKVVKP